VFVLGHSLNDSFLVQALIRNVDTPQARIDEPNAATVAMTLQAPLLMLKFAMKSQNPPAPGTVVGRR